MRKHVTSLILAAALSLPSTAVFAQSAPIEIKSLSSFAIMPGLLRSTGCTAQRFSRDKDGEGGEIVCDSQVQLEHGFAISPKLRKVCGPAGKKYMCTIYES